MYYPDIEVQAKYDTERIIRHVAPNGRFYGSEYSAVCPARPDKKKGSFKYSLEKQCWSDFATNETGHGPISYWAYCRSLRKSSSRSRSISLY